MSHRDRIATALAHAFLAGPPWTVVGLAARGAEALGEPRPWLSAVARAVRRRFATPPVHAPARLADFIRDRDVFAAAFHEDHPPHVRHWPLFTEPMRPTRFDVPPIPTVGDLAAFFRTSPNVLAGLADVRALERVVRDEKLRNYRYGWIAKRTGGARLLEAPKARLKAMQRLVLRAILDKVPPHADAHGFRAGGSPRSFAAPHAGQAIVVRVDLEDFFPSITAARVFGIFREVGYPESVSQVLTAIATNRLPPAVWRAAPRPTVAGIDAHFRLGRRLAGAHLPQGAPTSPALANLAAFRLDLRLAALAKALGGTYTRYADDLAFSGEIGFAKRVDRLLVLVFRIAREEGFTVNERKTRVLRPAARQKLAGLVVNAHPQVARGDYDTLKAILHNVLENGWDAENRDHMPDFRAHIQGRIAWVAASSVTRGRKLTDGWNAIARKWP